VDRPSSIWCGQLPACSRFEPPSHSHGFCVTICALRAAHYAYSCLRQPYGIGAFFLLALAIILGDSFRIPDKGSQGCVALVVRALQQAGLAFDRQPADMTPADLARNVGVLP
jgi:hypothetical protein